MTASHAEMVRLAKDYTLTGWTAHNDWNTFSMTRAEVVYFWDGDGKRYIDRSSQPVNVNVGRARPHIVRAIQQQAASTLP